jgi:hypothetical protein
MMALPLMERIQSPASSWPYAMSPLVTSLTKVNVSKGGPGYNTSNTHFTQRKYFPEEREIIQNMHFSCRKGNNSEHAFLQNFKAQYNYT